MKRDKEREREREFKMTNLGQQVFAYGKERKKMNNSKKERKKETSHLTKEHADLPWPTVLARQRQRQRDRENSERHKKSEHYHK